MRLHPSLRSYVERREEEEEKLIQTKLNEEVCIIRDGIVDSAQTFAT